MNKERTRRGGWGRAVCRGPARALRGESLDFWFEHAPGTRLMNEYGPTETVVGCSTYEPGPSTRGTVSIGRPMANVHMIVLGRWLELVPLGAGGGVCIG